MSNQDVLVDDPALQSSDSTALVAEDVVLDFGTSERAQTTEGPELPPDQHTDDLPPAPKVLPGFPLEGPYLTGPKPTGDHWEQCHIAVEKYDNDMCKRWREEVDTLLVFAGLFTAIVTAFTVESYQWLQPDPADATNVLLLHLSQQMANNSLPAASDPSLDFAPPTYAIRVNCFWFLSITISLAAGIIGILCKQWIHEFQRDAALPAKDALALRQLRYIGLKRWGVPHIISSPAILLQISLLLFLGGLVDFLWFKVACRPVAICATITFGLITSSMVLTTTLPLAYFLRRSSLKYRGRMLLQCPFISPQSYLLLKLSDPFVRSLDIIVGHFRGYRFSTWLQMERRTLKEPIRLCGRTTWDPCAIDVYRSMALQWVQATLAFNTRVRDSLYHCVLGSRVPCAANPTAFHVCLPETKDQCENDTLPDDILRVAYAPESRVLCSEIALRQQLLGESKSRAEDFFFEFLLAEDRRGTETPEIILEQAFEYVKYCIKYKTALNALSLWEAIFSAYIRNPSYDEKFDLLLEAFWESLLQPDPTGHQENMVSYFVCCLDAMFNVFTNIQLEARPIFGPLMISLKRSRHRLAILGSSWLGTADELVEKVLTRTTIRRDFFVDLQNDTIYPDSISISTSNRQTLPLSLPRNQVSESQGEDASTIPSPNIS